MSHNESDTGKQEHDQKSSNPASGAKAFLKLPSKLPIKYVPKELVHAEALSPVSVQVVFSKPLAADELEPEAAGSYFKFSGGLMVTGSPSLKIGSRASYILPTTLQKPGSRYSCSFRGGDRLGFRAGVDRIYFRQAVQTAFDTVELFSSVRDGVADYARVTGVGTVSGDAIELSQDNVRDGRYYQIVPPLEGLTLFIVPDKGQPLEAAYVSGTQLIGDRQAPRFRLPEGYAFTSGQRYTVYADWARIGQDSIVGAEPQTLSLRSIRMSGSGQLEARFSRDPAAELLAGRRLKLRSMDGGSLLTAVYVTGSTTGSYARFELEAGALLEPGVSYSIVPQGYWLVCPHSVRLQTPASRQSSFRPMLKIAIGP
ncbi:hypothetical protein M3223_17685 [Paenibacillus pasadenensis]|uniref:hypothetical protein n=1 Tax=Paenibacillus pasadenensis TaxID=217090 RepID=UPI002040DE3E|nr:hypothetical protein [Paenibacillus pasadenensis]MCM3749192.1 hypothetical protein [Paenibacillus pasadenensis]